MAGTPQRRREPPGQQGQQAGAWGVPATGEHRPCRSVGYAGARYSFSAAISRSTSCSSL
jgi:hypothetical protein